MPAVRDWGRREYVPSLLEMRALVQSRLRGEIDDTLVLVEHPAVVTIGVQGDDGAAALSGLPVVSVERGGHATYHGPGQLVGYPIVDLNRRGRDVRRFVRDLEGIVVDAVGSFGIEAGRLPGQPGVWVEGRRKIASIGIAVDHWVTFHGFAINVDLDLEPFSRFQPCGLDGSIMTSVARETTRPVPLDALKAPVVEAWERRFTGEPGPSQASTPLPSPSAA